MIFVSLGSQKFQFNRLLKALDNLDVEDEIFAQVGFSNYKPKNYKYKDFLDMEDFNNVVDKAEIIITHGGAGTIINSVKKGKKVIAVPRLKKYGEHVDDHQIQIVEEFNNAGLIYGCFDCDELGEAIKKVVNMKFSEYTSNTSRIIEDIDKYIKSIDD